MNRKSIKGRAQILRCLVEGNSIRSTARITGTSKNTILKYLCEIGAACLEYQKKKLQNLTCKNIQCDELWAFCYAKKKNLKGIKKRLFGYGDIWTWTAIDWKTKLVPAWLVGNRDAPTAKTFISDLASRLRNKVQLTTDGLKLYLEAVEDSFGADIDYAMLVKMYEKGSDETAKAHDSRCTGIEKKIITGKPIKKQICTSHVERQNLTMRMNMRRFTRDTNGFSKKVENHKHAVALNFMYYNFGRIHQTIRVSPAMEAGVTDHLWSIKDIVELTD
jgi:IS1 family transposase